ncbi:carbonic anhydrase [Mycena filopes]|nr:carbonic anhydrase [Mycena filopes]
MATPQEFLQANEKYATSFDKPDRSLFRNVITVACMDPRINPYDQLGVKFGEAIHIRNAGGSAKEALRSISVAQHFIGVNGMIAVFHHKDCGMSRVTTSQMRELVKKAAPGREDVAAEVDGIDFIHILQRRGITGWVYDVDTGKILQVDEAVAAGA